MVEIKYSPFNIDKLGKIKPPIPPDDLKHWIDKLYLIPRFNDINYPQGIFADNVGEHEYRLIVLSRSTGLGRKDPAKMERMLWVHDIPELIIGDETVISRLTGQNNRLLKEEDELEAARKLLSPSDVELIEEFNSGKKFLTGESVSGDISEMGILAVVADKIDGNMYFHYSVSNWLKNGGDHRDYRLESAFRHAFAQKQLFAENLSRLGISHPDTKLICEQSLEKQIEYIKEMWGNVPKRDIPEEMLHHLY